MCTATVSIVLQLFAQPVIQCLTAVQFTAVQRECWRASASAGAYLLEAAAAAEEAATAVEELLHPVQSTAFTAVILESIYGFASLQCAAVQYAAIPVSCNVTSGKLQFDCKQIKSWLMQDMRKRNWFDFESFLCN